MRWMGSTCRTFQYGAAPSQAGDLHLPSGPGAPVVCLLHGGFWRMPYGRDQFGAVAEDLAARGYAVWNLGYRRVGEPGGGWPGTLQDVVAGVGFLAELAAAGAPIDLDRIVLAGHSAGGQLALWAAAQADVGIRGVAALAAATDLQAIRDLGLGDGAVDALLGGSFPERLREASPMERLPLGVLQWIAHGTEDGDLPIRLSQAYADAAAAAGDDVVFAEMAGAGHMDCLDPRSGFHAGLCAWLAEVLP